MNDPADQQLSRRKARDRSLTLVLTGLVLLMPPMIGAALVDERIAGIPIPILYVFVVWALLVAGAAALSRTLRDSQTASVPERPRDRND